MAPLGGVLASIVTKGASLSMLQPALHFGIFRLLVSFDGLVTAQQITEKYAEGKDMNSKGQSPLCSQLTEDMLLGLSNLTLVDRVKEMYSANDMTKYITSEPSIEHAIRHFTGEVMLAGAFFMKHLEASNFEYPFKETRTPFQYAYKMMGKDELATQHTYAIMTHEGVMSSFNIFMDGKFGKAPSMPERVKSLNYDLDSAILNGKTLDDNTAVIVDIGGGTGGMLRQVKHSYPQLEPQQLIVQEYNPDSQSVDDLTIMKWDFKGPDPQPVRGAQIYNLTHILHNLSDLEALSLLGKVSAVMSHSSKLLIQEFTKNPGNGSMHATMILLYGGRLRSKEEWHQLAKAVGLKVTFEAYPQSGEGLIEMRLL